MATNPTLRQQATLEALIHYSMQRSNALSSFRNAVEAAAANASSLQALRADIAQLISELNTAEAVNLRLHQLRMQGVQSATYPDEDPNP